MSTLTLLLLCCLQSSSFHHHRQPPPLANMFSHCFQDATISLNYCIWTCRTRNVPCISLQYKLTPLCHLHISLHCSSHTLTHSGAAGSTLGGAILWATTSAATGSTRGGALVVPSCELLLLLLVLLQAPLLVVPSLWHTIDTSQGRLPFTTNIICTDTTHIKSILASHSQLLLLLLLLLLPHQTNLLLYLLWWLTTHTPCSMQHVPCASMLPQAHHRHQASTEYTPTVCSHLHLIWHIPNTTCKVGMTWAARRGYTIDSHAHGHNRMQFSSSILASTPLSGLSNAVIGMGAVGGSSTLAVLSLSFW